MVYQKKGAHISILWGEFARVCRNIKGVPSREQDNCKFTTNKRICNSFDGMFAPKTRRLGECLLFRKQIKNYRHLNSLQEIEKDRRRKMRLTSIFRPKKDRRTASIRQLKREIEKQRLRRESLKITPKSEEVQELFNEIMDLFPKIRKGVENARRRKREYKKKYDLRLKQKRKRK